MTTSDHPGSTVLGVTKETRRLGAYILIVIGGIVGFWRTQNIENQVERNAHSQIVAIENAARQNSINACQSVFIQRTVLRSIIQSSETATEQTAASNTFPPDIQAAIRSQAASSQALFQHDLALLTLPDCSKLPLPNVK